ncbi:MYG1 protein [Histomonas meleagridis]|uniref:MYG1 protein n=1 Tax=Histomonas meleagridis TaxID=135588 RepID=UPI00355A053A|nr:MYG1 protein [Histomonas meleagridis]KAH0799667.1 MYG1 protein [Histomonas meleagridis]
MEEQENKDSSEENEIDFSNKIALPQAAFSGEEAIAILILKWCPEFENFSILRTDNENEIEKCAIKISIQGEYNHENKTYVKITNANFPDMPSTLSVAGVVYGHYGTIAIRNKLKNYKFDNEESDIKFIFKKLYNSIIEPLDKGEYSDIRNLAQILDPIEDPDPYVKQELFEHLIHIIEEQFDQRLQYFTKKFIPSRNILRRYVQDPKNLSKDILVLPTYIPLEQNIDIIQAKSNPKNPIRFVSMPRSTGDAGVYALKLRPNNRLRYCGARNESLTSCLQNFPNIDCWIHPNGTIGGFPTLNYASEYLRQITKVDKGSLQSSSTKDVF